MTIEQVAIDKLRLDPKNDRFAELYSGSDSEDDLIEYLLYTEAAEDVAKNIVSRQEFYPDEALWVIANDDGTFLVKDGNRRCAAAKALQHPQKYDLGQPKFPLATLPVLIYKDAVRLGQRIQEQHTHSLFREWDPIAKALKAHQMYADGASEEDLRELDTNPPRLIRLASFYYEAVKVGGEDLKRLLRRHQAGIRGKTIIFERLFSYAKQCGYTFKGKSYAIDVLDKAKFESYIRALIAYLQEHPKTSHKDVDSKKAAFLDRLAPYGFTPLPVTKPAPAPSPAPQPATPPEPPTNTAETSPATPSSATATASEEPAVTVPFTPPKNKTRAYSEAEAESIVHYIAERFHLVARQLKDHRYNKRPTIEITDEYDVQDLFNALLCLFFDDVRREEPTPSAGGHSNRFDHFLKQDKIGVEIKKTRKGLANEAAVYDEILRDIPRYRAHPNCQKLLCFVYDPDGLLLNHKSLENDVRELSLPGFEVQLVVNQSR